MSEKEIQECIDDLNKILNGNFPDQLLLNSFIPVIPALFRLYCFAQQSNSHMKPACKDVLSTFFKLSDTSTQVLKDLILPPLTPTFQYTFCLGPTGGVCIKKLASRFGFMKRTPFGLFF